MYVTEELTRQIAEKHESYEKLLINIYEEEFSPNMRLSDVDQSGHQHQTFSILRLVDYIQMKRKSAHISA